MTEYNPATLPMSARGSREIVGAKCGKCGYDLPAIPTDKSGGWLWVDCPRCGHFNAAAEALKQGGSVQQRA